MLAFLQMKIRVLAFATAADAIGAGEIEVELPEDSPLADLLAQLSRDHPDLDRLLPRLAVAVDGKLAPPETPLSEGIEVALLPPVSGGGPSRAVGLIEQKIDADRLVAEVSDPASGAILVFLGTVRKHHRGRLVEKITYQAYRPMAQRALKHIVTQLEAASQGLRLGIVHRLGEVAVGETSVAIAASSPHRTEAYEASRTALERLKKEVPIWKREHYLDGDTAWREEEPLVS